jgi:hypothetical protein
VIHRHREESGEETADISKNGTPLDPDDEPPAVPSHLVSSFREKNGIGVGGTSTPQLASKPPPVNSRSLQQPRAVVGRRTRTHTNNELLHDVDFCEVSEPSDDTSSALQLNTENQPVQLVASLATSSQAFPVVPLARKTSSSKISSRIPAFGSIKEEEEAEATSPKPNKYNDADLSRSQSYPLTKEEKERDESSTRKQSEPASPVSRNKRMSAVQEHPDSP